MRPPADKILTFVDDTFFTSEDAEAKPIAFALGLLNHYSSEPTLSGAGKTEILTVGFHSTHWLLVARCSGHKKKEENGFSVAGWPKNRFSETAFAIQSSLIAARVFGEPSPEKIKMINLNPRS